MAALGSDRVSLKGDANEGHVELTISDTTYTRTLTRKNGTITTSGEPYLDDPTVVDLFAFLLESNQARHSVAHGENLRDFIMRPIDTDALRTDIEQRESERRRLDEQLEDLDGLKRKLPDLEDERSRLDSQITDIEERLEKREQLEDLRTRIERIETEAIEEFNDHIETVLDLLDYANIERIWLERVEREVREGRQKVEKSVFELHVVRTTQSGTVYEDTIEHLSESEREVTGLVFALACYLCMTSTRPSQ